jgi:hypothetical protein
MRTLQNLCRLAQSPRIAESFAISPKHLHVAGKFDCKPLQNGSRLRIFRCAAQRRCVTERNCLVFRMPVILAAPLLCGAPLVTNGFRFGGLRCGAGRGRHLLQAVRLTASEKSCAWQKSYTQGSRCMI